MIKKDEEIIESLEELDDTFSQINRILRKLKNKVECFKMKNKLLIEDYGPLIKFFRIRGEDEWNAENTVTPALHSSMDTQSFLGPSSPTNPFHKKNEADLEESQEFFTKKEVLENETILSEILEFDTNLLPEGFKEIEEIKMIYCFVQKKRTVEIEEIYQSFGSVSKEMIGIFLDVLVRKNFIRHGKGGVFSV